MKIYSGESKVRDRIVLPTPVVIAQPVVVVIGDVATGIPILGFARVWANEERGERIGKALVAEGFDLTTEFTSRLALELTAVGTSNVSAMRVQRVAPKPFKLWPDDGELPRGDPSVCFVDVLIVYGFVSPVTGADYEPYMVANLKIVGGEDHHVTYAEKFFYNFLGRNIEVTPTTPLPSWANGVAVETDVRGARDAFRNAVADLSRYIASHLKASNHLGKC